MNEKWNITNGSKAWKTEDELTFIAHLGKWSPDVPRGSRRTLLLQYQAAIAQRARWGSIDKQSVREALRLCLMDC